MTNESQRIQQQGRIFQVGQETGSIEGKCCQGEGGKGGKNPKWKQLFTCKGCGNQFHGKKNTTNQFCKQECQHLWVVNKWLPCSICLANLGFGCNTVSKLVGVASPNVSRGWKQRGIVPLKPRSGSWKSEIGKIKTAENDKEKAIWRKYESAWINEILSHGKMFDWSYIWHKESARRISNERYQSMAKEERTEWNRKVQEYRKERHKKNPSEKEKYRNRIKDWKKRNPDKNRESISKSIRKRKQNDPGFRVQCNLRNRLKEVMQRTRRGGTDHRNNLTGCTTRQLAHHLERQFLRGMTWDNYGTHWHVDHILPCASFDHTDEKQVRQCWHWTNLRPLWAKDNLNKGAQVTEPQMQLLLCATH